MQRSKGNDSVVILLLVIVLMVIVGVAGVGAYAWLRSRAVQRERALVQLEQARVAETAAKAAAEKAATLASSSQSDQSSDPAGAESSESSGAAARPQTGRSERDGASATASQSEQIKAIIRAQQASWNRGDIEAFMAPYWHSEQLTFSSGGRVTRGWQQTLQRYQTRYPTREAMGQLTFSDLEVTSLGESAALVLGVWRLEVSHSEAAGSDTTPGPQGNFTLVWQRLAGQWVIIHDHTSLLEPGGESSPPESAQL